MLPLLKRLLCEHKKWVDEEELVNCFAIGQCTPGIIAVNVATFCGAKRARFWGALCTTLGVVKIGRAHV